jgi:hypothetical protein
MVGWTAGTFEGFRAMCQSHATHYLTSNDTEAWHGANINYPRTKQSCRIREPSESCMGRHNRKICFKGCYRRTDQLGLG